MKKLLFLSLLMVSFVVVTPAMTAFAAVGDSCVTASNAVGKVDANGDCVRVAAAGTCEAKIDPITGRALPCSPTDSARFLSFINTVFNIVFGLLVIIASFFMLFAAFEYLTSAGDQEKIHKAKNSIVYAIVAIIVASFAWGLPRVIVGFLPQS